MEKQNIKQDYHEKHEYNDENSKNIVAFKLKFSAIIFLLVGVVLPFLAYGTWTDLNNYENGSDIRIHEIVWLVYTIAGEPYGKWLVAAIIGLASLIFFRLANKNWTEYRSERDELKNN